MQTRQLFLTEIISDKILPMIIGIIQSLRQNKYEPFTDLPVKQKHIRAIAKLTNRPSMDIANLTCRHFVNFAMK